LTKHNVQLLNFQPKYHNLTKSFVILNIVKKFLKNPSRTCITAEIGFNHNNIYLSKKLIEIKNLHALTQLYLILFSNEY
jgi:hypothetical protein